MKIVLDFQNIDSKEKIFYLFNNNIKFNEPCNNLDALYDELTSICNKLEIVILNLDFCKDKIGDYVNVLKNVLNDVQMECENIHIVYE